MTKRALTVDDSRSMREMVAFTLSQAGFDVLRAEDGEDALSVLDGQPVDIIVTDVNMPKMDGITLVEKLREMPAYRSVPILILTTESGDDLKTRGRAAGATGWIVKPFDPNGLIGVINKVCP